MKQIILLLLFIAFTNLNAQHSPQPTINSSKLVWNKKAAKSTYLLNNQEISKTDFNSILKKEERSKFYLRKNKVRKTFGSLFVMGGAPNTIAGIIQIIKSNDTETITAPYVLATNGLVQTLLGAFLIKAGNKMKHKAISAYNNPIDY